MLNVPIPQDPTSQPVINNPYRHTQFFWQLDENTKAYGPAIAGRRPSQIMPTIISGGKLSAKINQAMQMSTQFQELPLVNLVRECCKRWQKNGYPGATATTINLLRHWLDPEKPVEERLYFAQQDAILSHIYLTEGTLDWQYSEAVSELRKSLKDHLEPMSGIPRICHKMATGTGKTAVMAALILYHTANHRTNPKDPRFAGNFLILTPNLTVKTRLESALKTKSDEIHDEYAERDLLPSPRETYRHYLNQAVISINNWQAFKPKEIGDTPSRTAIDLITSAYPDADPRNTEKCTAAALRVAGITPKDGKALVINDEAHHCHYGNPDRTESWPDSATEWLKGIINLQKAGKLHSVVDLSATPIFPESSRKHHLFPWIVSDCNLIESQEAGMTKIPRAPASYGDEERARKLRNLYSETPKKERDNFDGRNCDLLRDAIRDLTADYVSEIPQWRVIHANDDKAAHLPAAAIVVKTTRNATNLYEYIAAGQAGETRLDNEPEHPFANWTNAGSEKQWLPGPPRTIVVHSDLEDPDKQNSSSIRQMNTIFTELAERYQQYYPEELEGLKPLEVIRKVLNSVGKPKQSGEHVRCIISVSMLTEGWDARNVTHLLGFRPFKSSLLCEQVAGRTLRRSTWEMEPETDRLTPQYATILGIPFRESKATPPDICKIRETITVSTPDENRRFEIQWPHIKELLMPPNLQRIAASPKTNPEKHRIPAPITDPTTVMPVIGADGELETPPPWSRTGWQFAAAAEVTNAVSSDISSGTLNDENGEPYDPQDLRPQALFCDLIGILKQREREGILLTPTNDRFPPEQERIKESADWLRNTVDLKAINPERPPMAISKSRIPWLTTEIPDYQATYNADRVMSKCRKSHATHAVCDSTWEKRTAEMLDDHPRVIRWVRNHRTRWEIPCVYQGSAHYYRPDFVAVVPTENTELHIVIEVKGPSDETDAAKRRWTESYWIPAVNADPEYGNKKQWSYLYLDEEQFLKGIESAFNQHVTREEMNNR